MAGIVDSIVQSDVPEKVAAGTEGFFQGALPTGVNNLAEEALGGAKPEEIKARAAANPEINHYSKLAGSILRDTVTIAQAGPAALVGNAILNVLGNTADQAANYDPNLSTESITSNVMDEMLGAAAGYAGGKVVGGLLGSGKYLMGAAKSAIQSTFGTEASSLTKAAEQALEQGVFDTARTTARENAKVAKAAINEKLGSLLEMADVSATAGEFEGNRGVQALFAREVQETHDVLGPGVPKAVKTELRGIVRELQGWGENLKPSDMLEVEGRIKEAQDIAVKQDDIVGAGAIDKLHMRVQKITNDFLALHGVSPDQVREIQQEAFAQDHVISMIPKGNVAEAAVRLAVRGPIIGAARAVPFGGELAAAALGGGARSDAASVFKGAVGFGAQKAYNVGSALNDTLGEFDKGIFAQYMAQTMQVAAKNAVNAALSDDVKPSRVNSLPDHVLPTLEDYEKNPQLYLKHLQDRLDKAPLSQTDKNSALEANQKAMTYLQQSKPRPMNPSPLAPPGARTVSKSAQITFHQQLRGVIDPIGTLSNPTQAGAQAVQVVHPSTYNAYIQEVLTHIGPNTKSNAKARKLLNTLGVDQSLSHAGQSIQSQYLPPQPHQGGAGRPAQKGGDKINLSVVNSSSTAIDKVEGTE